MTETKQPPAPAKEKRPELQKRVPMVDITPWGNYRETTSKEQDDELDASVKATGVIQSVLLRYTDKPDKYQLVIGSRRHASSKRNKLEDIPAIIRDLTDVEAAELQLIENIQRADVHAMEEARGFKRLLGFKKGNIHEVAACVGKHISYVARRMKLNDVYEEFQKAFHENRIGLYDIEKLFRISLDAQKELWGREYKKVKGEFDIDDYKIDRLMGKLSRAPFDTNDATIDPKAGACTNCTFNSAANTMLFPGEEKNATCGNIGCFNKKSESYLILKVKEAQTDPAVVIVTSRRSWEGESLQHKILSEHKIDVLPESRYNKVHSPDKKAIAAGKYIKALCIDGDSAGKYIYIQMVQKSSGKGSSAHVKEKLKSGKVTEADIDNEIKRIRDGEVRKKEIDEEKIAPLVYKILTDSKQFLSKTDALNLAEGIGMVFSINDAISYTYRSYAKGVLKAVGAGSDFTMELFDYLVKNPNKITPIINGLSRVLMYEKLQRNPGNSTKNAQSAAVEAIANTYDAASVKKIRDTQMADRSKREARVKERIEKLQAQKKDLKPAKSATSDKKSPAKKTAKKSNAKAKKK